MSIETQAPDPAQPLVLVPREPTPEMLAALDSSAGDTITDPRAFAQAVWKDMLAAAPAIPAPEGAQLPKGWRLQTVSDGDIRMYSPTGSTWLLRANTNEDFYDFIHGFLSDLMAAPAPQDSLDSAQCSNQVARQAHQAQWQPIETAPKDGTRFLGLHDGWHEFFHWQDGANEHTKGWPTGWRTTFTVYREGTGPTHWMPLPAAPQAQAPDPASQHDAAPPLDHHRV